MPRPQGRITRHTGASLRRSSKVIHEAAPERAVWRRRTPPDPGAGATVELSGGDSGSASDVVGVGQRRAGEGFAPEKAPPTPDEDQTSPAHRKEGVPDPRAGGQPIPDGATGGAG